MKKIRWIILIFLLFLPSLPAYAQEDMVQNVRVGRFESGNGSLEEISEKVFAVEEAYLQEIENYTNLHFSYVDCGSKENALAMLRSGEIDILGLMQNTEDIRKEFVLTSENYGIVMSELVCLKGEDFPYRDYNRIGTSTIGVEKNYLRMKELKICLEEKDITPNIRYYDTRKDVINALKKREVDLITADSYEENPNWDIVEHFCYSSLFFMADKTAENLIYKMDEGIVKCKLHNTGFEERINNIYYPNMGRVPFTREELDLIQKTGSLTVYYPKGEEPLIWEEDGELEGILVKVCDALSRYAGIPIQFKKSGGEKEEKNWAEFTGYTSDGIRGENTSFETTDMFLHSVFLFYHRTGEEISPGKINRVGVVMGQGISRDYIESQIDDFVAVTYGNVDDCFQALLNKNVDFVVVNKYVGDFYLIRKDLQTVTSVAKSEKEYGIGFTFHGEDAEALKTIFNKVIPALDETEVNRLLREHSLSVTADVTLQYFIKKNFQLMIFLGITILVMFILAGTSLTYAWLVKKRKQETEKFNKEKIEFFSRISHDMRTPMNGILGITSLASEDMEKNPENLKTDLDKIYQSGQFMMNLIQDTLDIQQMETGNLKLNLKACHPRKLIDNVISMIQVSAEEKNIDFQVRVLGADLDCYILTDPVRLQQVIMNILGNSVKYTPPGGRIEFIISCTGRTDSVSHITLTFMDNGIGISEKFLKNDIFKPYTQEKNVITDQFHGTGLGLPIVKNLVDMLGGEIKVKSKPGEGTIFILKIDMERVDTPKYTDNKEKMEKSLKGVRILLCEDHPINAEIINRILSKEGCIVDWAEDGEAGIKRFEESKKGTYRLIFMDIRMPKTDGLEAAMEIRNSKHPEAKSIPIIAMSANALEQDIDKALRAGMNEHLSKPVSAEALYEVIEEYV